MTEIRMGATADDISVFIGQGGALYAERKARNNFKIREVGELLQKAGYELDEASPGPGQ